MRCESSYALFFFVALTSTAFAFLFLNSDQPRKLLALREHFIGQRVLSKRNRIYVPRLPSELTRNADRTLFVMGENCHFRFNYVCKFWYYMRCRLLVGFPHVTFLQGDWRKQLEDMARPHDIVLFNTRQTDHNKPPEDIAKMLGWRDKMRKKNDSRAQLRFGFLHIANEKNRTIWPWYDKPDFILRNYWIPDLPRQVSYVPLGGQVPSSCPSHQSVDSANFTVPSAVTGGMPVDACECTSARLKACKDRKYLWAFIGSLRKNRRRLVRRLRDSDIFTEGYMHIAKKFGGDPNFGGSRDPKAEYLRIIQDTKFVLCPCGNVMETHRIYEALEHHAIPIIENCQRDVSAFFPLTQLVVDNVGEMIKLVQYYRENEKEAAKLQTLVAAWYRRYLFDLAVNTTKAIDFVVPPEQRGVI